MAAAAEPDVVICGGGIQGAAIAYFLTQRGAVAGLIFSVHLSFDDANYHYLKSRL